MNIWKKLTLGYLAAPVVIAVAGYVGISITQNALRSEIQKRMQMVAAETVEKIDQHIQDGIETMRDDIKDLDLKSHLIESNAQFDALPNVQAFIDQKDAEWKALPPAATNPFIDEILHRPLSKFFYDKVEFYENAHGYKVYPEIFVTNRYSAIVASSEKTSDYRQDDEDWYQQGMKSSGYWVGDAEYDESSDSYAVSLVFKIFDEKQNVVGIFKPILNLTEIIQTLKKLEIGKNSHFKLLTPKGEVIYSTFRVPFLKNVSNQYFFKQITGEQGSFVAPGDDSGVKSELFSYARSMGYLDFKGTNWILTVEQDADFAFAPVIRLRNFLIGVVAMAVSIPFLLGLFLARSISKPILQLKNTVLEIAKGNLKARTPLHSKDEIGVLAQSFNQMAADLEKHVDAQLHLQISALEAAGNGIVITDFDGTIIWTNRAFSEITGYTKEEAKGKNPRILKSGEQPREVYTQLWNTIKSGKIWTGEVINRRKDGALFFEFMTITPIRDKSGTITHFVAIKQDISERKKMEAQLRQSQKMEAVGQLAGGVAHDFNNLLTVIIGRSDFVSQELDAENPAQKDVKEVLQAAKRASNLTRQLMAFSRKQILQTKVMDLNEIVKEAYPLIRRLIREDIELTINLDEQLKKVKVDPSQIEQVIMNLAVNARDSMPGRGKIIIETHRADITLEEAKKEEGFVPGEYVLLSVRDTGTGMTPEIKRRIFEPFFTTKEKGKGTGLGLATVYGIVKQSQGFIYVDSELNKGTTFRFYLPVCEKQELVKTSREESYEPLCGKECILVAEDEEVVRGVIMRSLTRQGYQTIEATNGLEALRKVRENQGAKIQMLITDMVMPHMGGGELAEKFSAIFPQAKIIFTSGYTDQMVVQKWIDRGCKFLQKPYTPSELLLTIRQVLDQKSTTV